MIFPQYFLKIICIVFDKLLVDAKNSAIQKHHQIVLNTKEGI